MATAEQMDALLEGLSAEDLDMDFDPNEEDMGEEKEVHLDRDVDVGFGDCAPSFVPAGAGPSTPFVGFVTGRNTVIPAPSSEAFAKVRKIFDEDPVLAEVASTLGEPPQKRPRLDAEASALMPPPRTSGFATAGGRVPPPISPSAQAATANLFSKPAAVCTPLPSAPSPAPASSGFATASGRAPPPISPAAAMASRALFKRAEIPPPPALAQKASGFATAGGSAPPPISRAAAASAESLFSQPDPVDSGDEFRVAPLPPSPSGTFSLGFQTGAGKIVAPPSSAARARAMAMFEDPDPPVSNERAAQQTPTPRTAPLPFAPPRSAAPTGLTTGSGRPAALPSQIARERIGAIFEDDQNSRPLQPSSQSSAFITPRPPQSRQSATGVAFRTPLRATTNTPSQGPAPPAPAGFTGSPAPRKFKPIEIGTPILRRRVGLGMTPSRFGKSKAGFSSPFKVGPAAETAPLPRTSAAPPVVAAVTAPVIQAVFDLTKTADRKTYREAYLKPQYHTIPELVEQGIPQEIYVMDFKIAKAYRFVGEDDSDLGPVEALAEVKAAGCELATPAWVLNHWCMILWKLAGVIQAQYSLYDELWSWEVVISQLLYRYEREYNRAERPIVRRIHEHDSSPSLPLVLCVSAIMYPPPQAVEDGEKQEPANTRPCLELTDGWYRISAQVDECLARAIARGKVRVGRKLAITGAKLESSSEGVDPLESLDKTLLTIAGNSTKLASWDAKLGRQNEPFVSGLSSLSVDGGVISLMDIVIDKLFPVAYSWTERGKFEPPWDEEEERLRQDAWSDKYAAESTRLQDEMRKQLEKVEDVVNALCSAAEGLEGEGGGDPPDNVDQIFDGLLESKSIDARLRTMASSTLLHVAAYGRLYHERESSNAFLEVEAELQVLCPPRLVRDFRIARVSDARRGNRPVCRAGMLNVWDAIALGKDALVEGKRYMGVLVTGDRLGFGMTGLEPRSTSTRERTRGGRR